MDKVFSFNTALVAAGENLLSQLSWQSLPAGTQAASLLASPPMVYVTWTPGVWERMATGGRYRAAGGTGW